DPHRQKQVGVFLEVPRREFTVAMQVDQSPRVSVTVPQVTGDFRAINFNIKRGFEVSRPRKEKPAAYDGMIDDHSQTSPNPGFLRPNKIQADSSSAFFPRALRPTTWEKGRRGICLNLV